MASTAPTQDANLLLTAESAGNAVEGSLAVLGAQRAEGGYTVYRLVFKVGLTSRELAEGERERERGGGQHVSRGSVSRAVRGCRSS